MAERPRRFCSWPGYPRCSVLVPRGRCAAHAVPLAKGWRGDEQRVRGRKLQRLRAALFAREPFCRVCRAAGRRVVAVIRDHIVPLAEGGTDADENIQPLCQVCSDSKTAGESLRGRVGGG